MEFGGQKLKMSDDFDKYFKMWQQGEISTRKAASALNMNHSTFYRRCLEQIEEEGKFCYKK